MVQSLIDSSLTNVLLVAIDPNQQEEYHIISCIIWYHDKSGGSFIPLVSVLDKGDDTSVKLSSRYFQTTKDTANKGMFPKDGESYSFQNLDLCKFMMSMVQLISSLGPSPNLNLKPPSSGFKRHHLYLQCRLEQHSRGYWIYVIFGFDQTCSSRLDFLCMNYFKEIPIGSHLKKKQKSGYGIGYYPDDWRLQ